MTASGDDPERRDPPAKAPSMADLDARIKRVRAERDVAHSADGGARQGDMTALARGLRIAAEFVAAILVGTGIGWGIDQLAGTAPWGMLIMFMVGFAAGILNVTRVVAEWNAQGAAPRNGGDGADRRAK